MRPSEGTQTGGSESALLSHSVSQTEKTPDLFLADLLSISLPHHFDYL